MSIFDMFKTTPADASQQMQPAQQPAVQAPVQQAQAGNIQDPASLAQQSTHTDQQAIPPAQDPANAQIPDTPLSQFVDLWENTPNKENPNAPVALNQQAVQEAVAKTDFSQSITPEQLQTVTAGGEGAEQALAQMLNNVAQQVMVQSTMVNNKLSEQALGRARTEFESSIPSMLRAQQAKNHLNESNPLFSNPAIQPVVQATQQQLLQKFPNATQAELTKMTQDYITAMGEAFAPKQSVNDNAALNETDWDAFLAPVQ